MAIVQALSTCYVGTSSQLIHCGDLFDSDDPLVVAHPSLFSAPIGGESGGGPHSHVDADIPASIARDSELVTSHGGLSGVTADQHHAESHASRHASAGADAVTPAVIGAAASGHNHDAAYSATGHSHGGGSEAFPVGGVFIAVVSTNPATLLGYGTWSAFGAGRVLVGLDSGDTAFDTVEETGGAKTHTLTESEIPSHTHTQNSHNHTQDAHNHTQNAHVHDEFNNSATTGGLVGWGAQDTSTNTASLTGYDTGSTTATNIAATATNQAATATNQNTGGGGAHNNLQPYIVVFMWKRTA